MVSIFDDGDARPRKKITVPFDHVVGEGYMKNTLEYRETMAVTVRFDKHGHPFTAFPDLKAGR